MCTNLDHTLSLSFCAGEEILSLVSWLELASLFLLKSSKSAKLYSIKQNWTTKAK